MDLMLPLAQFESFTAAICRSGQATNQATLCTKGTRSLARQFTVLTTAESYSMQPEPMNSPFGLPLVQFSLSDSPGSLSEASRDYGNQNSICSVLGTKKLISCRHSICVGLLTRASRASFTKVKVTQDVPHREPQAGGTAVQMGSPP